MENKKRIIGGMISTLILMYLVTGLLLLLLALLMYRMDLSAQTAEIAIILIYILSGLFGGFLIGKKLKTRKYLWGLAAGLMYFGILLLASLIVGGGKVEDTVQILITLVLCALSGMIGGMVS